MKKKVLILSHAMELGGAERSLIGLLTAFDRKDIQVDLFLFRHEGELMGMIPDKINLLPEIPEYTVLARPMKDILKEGHLLLTGARVLGKVMARRYVKKYSLGENGVALEYSHKYTYKLLPQVQPGIKYDTVISFLTPHYIAANRVTAKKRICWIHTDYKNVAVDRKSELLMWNSYDYIVAVSEAVRISFIFTFPELKSKVIIIENILSKSLIVKQAYEKNVANEISKDGTINLLSVGRFSTSKNFINVAEICKIIRNTGLNVKWYLIGFGPDEKAIKEKIIQNEMTEYVIILGKKNNPYPYIKTCDLYVQPSRYEGKCVAVREAQMLEKPVIITNYETASSQVEDQVDGIIVPLNNEDCAKGIVRVLKDKKQIEKLRYECKKRDYSNMGEIEKLYALIDT